MTQFKSRQSVPRVISRWLAMPVAGAGLALAGSAWGTDADRGEYLAFKYHCVTCHGDQGQSNSGLYPNLAGQHAAYIDVRLKYFRSEVEPGNLMNAQAVHLEDDEIADLAAFFSEQSR